MDKDFYVLYGDDDSSMREEFETLEQAREFYEKVCENPNEYGVTDGFRAEYAILRQLTANDRIIGNTLDSWEEDNDGEYTGEWDDDDD